MPNSKIKNIGKKALKAGAAGIGGVAAVDEAIIVFNLINNLLTVKYKMDPSSALFLSLSCSMSTLAAVASTEMKATADEIPHAFESLFDKNHRAAIGKSLVGEKYTRLPGSFLALLLATYYEISIFVLSKEEAEKLFHNNGLAISIAACNVSGHLCLEVPTFVTLMGDASEYLCKVAVDKYTASNTVSVLSDIKKNLSLSRVLASLITLFGTMGMMGKLAIDFAEVTEHHFSHEAAEIAARSAFYIGLLMAQGKIAVSVAHTLDIMFNKLYSLASSCMTSSTLTARQEAEPLLAQTALTHQPSHFPTYFVVPGYFMLMFLASFDSLAFGLSNMQGIAEGLEKRFNFTTGFNETFDDLLFHPANTNADSNIESLVQTLLIVGLILGLAQRLFFQGRAILEEVPHVANSIILPCWNKLTDSSQAIMPDGEPQEDNLGRRLSSIN